ncbi:hypothetical protein ELH26_35130 [Rhizobium leguminosarum]|uniref:alpha/beta hydrolase n=1 Tax=Rhizobium leguminosarum TaxID=384 RepID=UPI001031CBE3|nr:hypothetical protein ELH26_35130 [Rhizobium leguminosarum]
MLVGQSLGVAFALRLIERAADPVAGVFLAAGFVGALVFPTMTRSINRFLHRPSTGRRSVNARGQYSNAGQNNESYVQLSRSREVATCLDAPLEIVPDGGHLDSETALIPFRKFEMRSSAPDHPSVVTLRRRFRAVKSCPTSVMYLTIIQPENHAAIGAIRPRRWI